jgi:hypothetical protein
MAGLNGGATVFPECPKCDKGVLLPLSDYGQDGATVLYKAWACIKETCGYTLRVDKGKVAYESNASRN